MPAYYIFDQDQQSGPYEPKQIAAMWKQGLLTANAQYFDDTQQEWRPLADLVAATTQPFRTAWQQARAEMKTPEAKARQKKIARIYWISLAVAVPLLVWFFIAIEKTPEERDREWQATVNHLDDWQAQQDKKKEEAWKARNREAARRYLRNHPDGRP